MERTLTLGHVEAGRPWQVIFRTIEGLDYCRETRPAHLSIVHVMEWARRQLVAHNLGSARVERW